MPKQPKPIVIKCQCGQDHQVDLPKLMEALPESHMPSMLDYVNEIDWLKQRVEELEDELFCLTEYEPPSVSTNPGDIPPRIINMGDIL